MSKLIPLSCLCGVYEATADSWLAKHSIKIGNMKLPARSHVIEVNFYTYTVCVQSKQDKTC